LSDYMIRILRDRHSSRDCRNPSAMDSFEIAIHGAGNTLPGGYDELTL